MLLAFACVKEDEWGRHVCCNMLLRTYPALVRLLQGEMKSGPLSSMFTGYQDGKKCATAIRLDPAMDFNKLKAGQLRQILADKGIECRVGPCQMHEQGIHACVNKAAVHSKGFSRRALHSIKRITQSFTGLYRAG